MAEQFPDITSKLSVPQKQSLFERNRAEAEAKRQRAEAETAAVLTDFVKSFDDDENESRRSDPPTGPRAFGGQDGPNFRSGGAPPRRQFGGLLGRNSGPGSLNTGPGSLGSSPATLSRKRTHDGARVQEGRGIFGHEDKKQAPMDAATAFQDCDEEVEDEIENNEEDTGRAVPKPTVQLSSLPPGSSTAFIKDLLPETLKVGAVRIVTPQEPSGGQSTARRSISAVVTLAQDTPASDIDTAVNSLQNKYLGWGFYLSLSRHLSSAGLSSLAYSSSPANALPFGAKPPPQPTTDQSRGRPHGGHRGAFAPPESYDTPSYGPGRGAPSKIQINVQPPTDINQLKLIHKTVESLITHGPEFEALLMSRPEVQRDEKWAWIWDSRSPGGVWYRWRLWEIVTGEHTRRSSRKPGPYAQPSFSKVFQGEPLWCAPDASLPYEFITSLDEFVSDSAYDSSEEDDSDDEDNPRKRRRQQQHDGGAPPPPVDANTDVLEKAFLNSLHRAKLTHLLSRLPLTQAKLRRGDVARVTIFAIKHASEGAEEIVDMLVGNVLRPLATSTCGKHEQEMAKLVDGDRYSRSASPPPSAFQNGGTVSQPESDHPNLAITKEDIEMRDSPRPASSHSAAAQSATAQTQAPTTTKKEDTSPASLLALHLISDILSASSTSGIRHAWRYRSLFESALRRTHVFARLGRLDRDHGWGRLRAEKWKRSVGAVLGLWEGWSVFEGAAMEGLRRELEEPPLTEAESKEKEENARRERHAAKGKGAAAAAGKSRWKSVTAAPNAEAVVTPDEEANAAPLTEAMDIDKPPAARAPADPTTAADVADKTPQSQPQSTDGASDPKPPRNQAPTIPGETAAAAAKRRRLKATDLLGD